LTTGRQDSSLIWRVNKRPKTVLDQWCRTRVRQWTRSYFPGLGLRGCDCITVLNVTEMRERTQVLLCKKSENRQIMDEIEAW